MTSTDSPAAAATDTVSVGAATTVRPARLSDVPAIVAMVHELAEYERAAEHCHLTETQLRAAMFGAQPSLFGHLATDPDGEPIGFALWFLNFSTWTGSQGLYLDDLFVRPRARGTGSGRLLLAALAAVCVERGYPRLEWRMLDWNPAAKFYRAIGAKTLDDQVLYQLSGPALQALGGSASAMARPGTG